VSKVRTFKPENRLARALNDPSGMLFAHALERAESNLEKVRPAHEAALERKLNALRELAPFAHANAEQRAALYRLAQDVLADAGGLGEGELSRAALSLCDLLGSVVGGERLKLSVAVHLEAIAALRASKGPQEKAQREAILAGLVRISGKAEA